MAAHDIDLMQLADGELEGARESLSEEQQLKAAALDEMGEAVRGHLELSADAIPDRRFDAMWREIDEAIGPREPIGVWARITTWFEHYRGHVITSMVSAGAVAALALVLRGGTAEVAAPAAGAIDVQPAALRPPPVIEDLETPGGNSTVLNVEDDDGHMTVIVVTPADTVEGI
jgi:hypothetical protein